MVKKFRLKRGVIADIPEVDPEIMESGNLRSEKSPIVNKASDFLQKGVDYFTKSNEVPQPPQTYPSLGITNSEIGGRSRGAKNPLIKASDDMQVMDLGGADAVEPLAQPIVQQTVVQPNVVTKKEPGFLSNLADTAISNFKEIKKQYVGKPGAPVRSKADDVAAYEGGFKWSYQGIDDDLKKIAEDENTINSTLAIQESKVNELDNKYNFMENENDANRMLIYNLQNKALTTQLTPEEQTSLGNAQKSLYKNNLHKVGNKLEEEKEKLERLKATSKQLERRKKLNDEKRNEYERAVVLGRRKMSSEHGWRKEWMQPIAENTESMIGKPNIGNASDIANYGPLNINRGFDSIIKPVQIAPGANNWARTTIGDRGLVEGLVKVNQNNMITPFGVPGTVAGGNSSRLFTHDLNLNRIGVGDVTARPGYRINIEDIRRNKAGSKPSVIRKKLDTSKVKKSQVGIIKGSLKMSIPKSMIITSMGKSNSMGSLVKNLEKPKNNSIKMSNFKNSPMKLNIPSININADKPQSGAIKINSDGIVPFTFKNIETNLNNTSNSMKKKMKVSV